MVTIDDYVTGRNIKITKKEEDELLGDCKNTGSLAESYVENILKENSVKYKKHPRVNVGDKYVIPDFYLYELDIILEIKSRGYHCPGTASEKVDHIPRKYSKLTSSANYTNTKIFVVFCSYETINPSIKELVEQKSSYSIDFTNMAKKYNVVKWINISDLLKNLPIKVKPFVKWVGGKKKIAKEILKLFPETYNDYYEPFIGGGCIGLSLDIGVKKIFSDINFKLIECYKCIKSFSNELIEELSLDYYTNTKERFLEIREKFNSGSCNNIQTCAMFIYLNKCCFNGMYRENSSGIFNVPFGSMKNPVICDKTNIKNLSKFLQKVDINSSSFLDIKPSKGDLVYFDPPYHQTFSNYNKEGFDEESHRSLKNFVDDLSHAGVKVIISNSDTNFIKDLYSNYTIYSVKTNYSVGVNREKSTELVITNF